MYAIEVRDVHKSFNGIPVLKGVDLQIPRGEITVVVGGSGVGKSVLLKHMIGLIKPDRGSILVDGVDITHMGNRELNRLRRKFGMLFQSAALFDSMTVEENVAFPLREHTDLKPREIRRVVRDKLRLVGLERVERKMPAELSGGMRKRVGLARAIALEPEIILYDEPTTGLDPILCDAIERLIKRMQQELDITSVVISHDIGGSFRIANHMAMLHGGQIIETGTPEEFRNSAHPVVRQFLSGSSEGPIKVH